MANILVSCLPASGHVNPLLAIAQALVREGHTVAFCTDISFEAQLKRAGFQVYPMAYPEGMVARHLEAFRRPAKWLSQFSTNPPQGVFFKDLDALTASLIRALREFGADVLMADMNQYANPIAAEVCGIPYADYCAIVNPLPSPDVPPFGMGLPWAKHGDWRRWFWKPASLVVRVIEWHYDRIVNRVRKSYNLPQIHGALLAHSPYLTMIPVTEAYEYPHRDSLREVMYVGPVTTTERGEVHDDFPWEWFESDPRPTLYVSMGTIVGGVDVFRHVIELAHGANWKAMIALGSNGNPTDYEPLPPNVLVRKFVPQLDILKRVDGVLTHGGNNTVTESLLNGLPMVVIPISADQPDSAAHIQASGVGIRLSPHRLKREKLGKAINEILTNPSYRREAQRIQASYQQTDGATTAAKLVGLLAEQRAPIHRPADMPPTILLEDVGKLRKRLGLL